jgi:hypothetical protein
MHRDQIVQEREHHEVEHDRRDHFVRAEPCLEDSGNPADHAAGEARGDHVHRKHQQRGQAGGQSQADERRDESTRGQLALGADVEQPGAQCQRDR